MTSRLTGLAVVLTLIAAPAAVAAPPETTITSGPPQFTHLTSAEVEFESNPAGGTFACRLDDQVGFSACQSPRTINNLGEGEHTLRVRATVGGETDDSPAVHKWTVDLTPPDTTITNQPDAATSSQTATFEFASPSGEPVVFRCSLNGNSFEPCESPIVYSGLGDGTREFRVRARDRALNFDPTPPAASWTVDATPPETTISQAPSGLSREQSPQIRFEAGEAGATFQCSVNGADFAACASPFTASSSWRQGDNAFRVRALDAVGNADPSPARVSWERDTIAPEAPYVRLAIARAAPRGATASQVDVRQKPVLALKPFDRPWLAGTPRYLLDRRLQIAWKANGGADGIKFDVSVSESAADSFGGWFSSSLKAVLSATTATEAIFVAKPGLFYCFEVAARDAAGNWSPVSSACSYVPIRARDIPRGKKTSAPVRTAKKSYLGEYRLLKRGSLVLDAVDDQLLRRFSLVATTCPSCGKVVVKIERKRKHCVFSVCQLPVTRSTTVSLKSTKTKRRQIVPVVISPTMPPNDRYTVTVKRSSGKPQIEGLAFSPN